MLIQVSKIWYIYTVYNYIYKSPFYIIPDDGNFIRCEKLKLLFNTNVHIFTLILYMYLIELSLGDSTCILSSHDYSQWQYCKP